MSLTGTNPMRMVAKDQVGKHVTVCTWGGHIFKGTLEKVSDDGQGIKLVERDSVIHYVDIAHISGISVINSNTSMLP